MNSLSRWNPVADVLATSRAMDRLFDQFWPTNGGYSFGQMLSVPAIDVSETEQAVIVHAEVPGFKPEQIDARIEGNILTLKGEYSTDEKREEGHYHVRECSTSSFNRSVVLPIGVDSSKSTAEFENGVLTLTMPKQPDAMPKRINIVPKPLIAAEATNGKANNGSKK